MARQRRRTITVTDQDRERLGHYKKMYEEMRGLSMTWGEFLVSAAYLGMAAACIEQIKDDYALDSGL